MPTPKRRRFLIRQRWKRRAKFGAKKENFMDAAKRVDSQADIIAYDLDSLVKIAGENSKDKRIKPELVTELLSGFKILWKKQKQLIETYPILYKMKLEEGIKKKETCAIYVHKTQNNLQTAAIAIFNLKKIGIIQESELKINAL